MKHLVAAYLQRYPDEFERTALVRSFFDTHPEPESWFSRMNFGGHVTASGFVLSPDGAQIAVVFHKVLNRHLQPGGHVEASDTDVLAAAQREVAEETGILRSIYKPVSENSLVPFDLDSHLIPANPRKQEPAHYHHDFRYLFQVESEHDPAAFAIGDEAPWSWRPIADAIAEPSFQWVVRKLNAGWK